MPTLLAPVAIQQFKDNNGGSLVGGQLYTYQAGTSIPAPSYTDATGTSANSNPVILNSRGEAPIWLTPGQFYKLVLQDASGVMIWTADQVPGGFVDAALLPNTASSNLLRADLASITDLTKGAALVGFYTTGTAALGRTVQAKLRDIVSLTDTTADFTGVIDATVAINDRMALVTVGGGIVYLGKGVLSFTNLNVPAGVELMGQGPYATVLSSTSLATDNITLNDSAGLSKLRVTASAPKTASDSVKIIGNACFVQQAEIQNYFVGVGIRGAGGAAVSIKSQIVSVTFTLPSITAGNVMILGGMYSNLIINRVLGAGPSTGTQPTSGIRLLNGDTAVISDTNITRHGAALLMDPDTNQNIYATQINNCLFDSAVGRSSAEITPRGGNIYSTKISNSWFGLSNQNGLLLTSYGAGVADGVEITGCEFPANVSHGLQANGPNIRNLKINGGWATGNTGSGYCFTGSIIDFSLGEFKAGNVGSRGANSGYGVRIDAGSDGYRIHDGDVRGNTAGTVLYPAAATNGVIDGITGFNPVGISGVTVGVSPFTVTAGSIAQTVYITGGTVSAVALNGTTIFSASPATIHLGPNESVVVTYSVIPFINKFVH